VSLSQIIHRIRGGAAVPACSSAGSFFCWVCGGASTRGQVRWEWAGANYTGQNKARCPDSNWVCEACVSVMAGRPPDTERMWSHLVEGDEHVRVNKGGKPTMRAFLRREHSKPWAAAIADSGQKHIIPWTPVNAGGQVGGRVLFEEMLVDLPRDAQGWALLDDLEVVLTDGLTKEEIARGEYGPRAWQLLGADRVREFEGRWGSLRGGGWFELAVWLAQRDEAKVQARLDAEKAAKKEKGKNAVGRTSKGAAAKPARGGGARAAGGVPEDAGGERPKALGSAPGSNEGGGAEQRDAGGVDHDDDSNTATRGAPGGQLALF